MKHLIKKLLREGLLNESEMKTAQEVGISDKIFYHGTQMKIDKLDPDFRQNNSDAMGDKRSGSAANGAGIYFSPNLGFDPNNLRPDGSSPVDGGENAYKWAYGGGYIYMMKLKPTANIIDDRYDKTIPEPGTGQNQLDVRNITPGYYKILRENGVDGVWDERGKEFVLLNREAVESWGLAYKVVDKFKISKVSGLRPDWDNSITLDEEEVEPYLKEKLGDNYKKYPQKSKGFDIYHDFKGALGVMRLSNTIITI
jgi:hypothetical protein